MRFINLKEGDTVYRRDPAKYDNILESKAINVAHVGPFTRFDIDDGGVLVHCQVRSGLSATNEFGMDKVSLCDAIIDWYQSMVDKIEDDRREYNRSADQKVNSLNESISAISRLYSISPKNTLYGFDLNGKTLRLEQNLYAYDNVSYLAVYIGDDGSRYLAFCSDDVMLTHSVIPVSVETILDMLDNKVSMDRVFIDAKDKHKYTAACVDGHPGEPTAVASFTSDDYPQTDSMYGDLKPDVKKYADMLRSLSEASK